MAGPKVPTPQELAASAGVPMPTIQTQTDDPKIYWGPWVHPAGSSYNVQRSVVAPKYDPTYDSQVPDFDPTSQIPGYTEGLQREGVRQDYYSQVPKAAQEDYSDAARLGPQSESTVSSALQYLATLQATDEEKFWDIGDDLVRLGYIKAGYSSAEVYQYWKAAAEKAAFIYNNGAGTPLTINQVLNMDSPAFGGSGFSDLAGTQTGPGRLTTHQTSTQTNISSRSEIKGAARDISAQALGRDLSPAELARVAAYVQGAQANHPTISSRTDVPVGETGTRSTITTRGGLDMGTTIEDRLRENPDYAEHQAAAVYAPALFQALGATV